MNKNETKLIAYNKVNDEKRFDFLIHQLDRALFVLRQAPEFAQVAADKMPEAPGRQRISREGG